MEKREIIPPDEYDIQIEMDDIIQNGDRKPIARWSKIKYWRICAMLRTDDPQANIIYEAAAFLYGVLKLDKEKARKVFNILYRLALEWGLVDDEPVVILEMARDRLRQVRKQGVKHINAAQATDCLAMAAKLENEITGFTKDLVDAETSNGNGRRQYEPAG